MRRISVSGIVALFISVAAAVSADEPNPKIGSTAPDFEVIDVTGQFSGKPVPVSYRRLYGDRVTICIFLQAGKGPGKRVPESITPLLLDVDRMVERGSKMGWVAFFVLILSGDEDVNRKVDQELKDLSQRLRLRNLPLTRMPQVPEGYSDEKPVSVVMWERSTVRVNLAFETIDKEAVGRVQGETRRFQ